MASHPELTPGGRHHVEETPRWRRYLRFWGPDPAADAADELAFHLEMLVEENVAAGMSPAQARRSAQARLGDRRAYENQCRDIGERRVKRMRRAEQLDSLWHDLSLVLRSLRRSPGFTAATIAVLALGIGIDLVVFSIFSGVLLRPLPFREPERLVQVFELFPLAGGEKGEGSVSYPNYRDWKQQARSFSALAVAGWPTTVICASGGEPERWTVVPVGSDLFPLLGVPPLLGRALGAADRDVGAEPVVVLSEPAWRGRFGGDATVVGRALVIDGRPHTVVGVMPAGFRFPVSRRAVDGWVPLGASADQAESRGSHHYAVVGRLRDGHEAAAAQQDVERIAAQIAELYPELQEGRSAALTPLREAVVGGIRDRLLALFAGATLVLLVACANAAGLLLARGIARRRDVAVQAALGATRGRIVRQLLVESLVLSGVAALVGVGICWFGLRALRAAGDILPRAADIGFDVRVVAFVIAVTLLTGLLFGLAPALRASRVDLQQDLRAAGRQAGAPAGTAPFRNGLVVAQLALALVLLTSAGLLLRGFLNLMATETGMQSEGVLTLRIAIPDGRHRNPVTGFWEPLRERLTGLPGVTDAGFITQLPL